MAERNDRAFLDRAVALLSAFGTPLADALTLTQLSARTGLPTSTAHRICGQLVETGLLERLPSGAYRVGLRTWELGTLAQRPQELRDVALPYLEDLFAVTRQHVQLTVVDGTDAVVIERISASNAVRLEGRAGGRLPLNATSGGIALLAFSDESTLAAVLAAPPRRYTPRTPVSEEEIRSAMDVLRRQGWIELREAVTPGVLSIAAPVLAPSQGALAAVSVVLSADSDTRMLAAALRTTALTIGRAWLQARRRTVD